MIVDINASGYEALRERTPIIEWYIEFQKSDGTPAFDRRAISTYRTSAVGVTPMTFSFPITGADCISRPCTIEQLELFETALSIDPLSQSVVIEPLLLALEGDTSAVIVTITLPVAS